MSIKVAITDDHPLAITGIKTMLSTYPQIEVTDTYDCATALMDGLSVVQPDVLLLDVLLPDQSGRELVPIILKKYPEVRIVALTSLDAPAVIKSMMQHGCYGYLLKDSRQEVIVTAIEHAYKKEEFIEPRLQERLMKNMFKSRRPMTEGMPDLTQREKEILQLIATEFTMQEIADKLFISLRTVETHRYTLMQKLKVKNTAGLVRMSIMMGIVE